MTGVLRDERCIALITLSGHHCQENPWESSAAPRSSPASDPRRRRAPKRCARPSCSRPDDRLGHEGATVGAGERCEGNCARLFAPLVTFRKTRRQ